MRRLGLSIVFTVVIALPILAQGRGQGYGRGSGAGMGPGVCQNLAALPLQSLSQAETNALIYMREEEKLARDVYRGLFQKWGMDVFARIATSEQRHTEAIKVLIARYELSDPVKDDTPGVFTDKTLGVLYHELIAEGLTSETAALRVGAKIEDLDIHDLAKALKETDNEDIKLVFGNLSRASGNHLRAFTGQLESAGETYLPQFIPAAEYDEIVNAPGQTGRGPGNGRGWRGGRQPETTAGGAAPRCWQN